MLIKHVLQSILIHCLSVMNPSIGVMNQIQKMIAQFFWSNCIGHRGRHLTKWKNLCLPESEGGLGFRLMHDATTTLFLNCGGMSGLLSQCAVCS